MSLGVLNNLNAINAEANLNNTSASLSKTLQQLSSGSKINSGADDAAGLSLVNGLQANSMALTQSQTNSTEGVGLLTVADGALSQVTNLLNRAVTLATEASNGTLNTSQDTAANQEYQSILSEISNIGTTTTYNDRSVFGTNTNIYTGDSTTTGASVDSLNIRSLSSSNVGDTGGAIAYGTGSSGNNVFIDLAGGTTSGAIGDTLNTTGTTGTTLTINTLSSTGTVVANNITVGGSSGFDNTAQGMINAINSSGLGVTASFTSAAVAGDSTATATDMGIMISGSVGAGAQPSASSFSGVVAAAGDTSQNANKDDIVSGQWRCYDSHCIAGGYGQQRGQRCGYHDPDGCVYHCQCQLGCDCRYWKQWRSGSGGYQWLGGLEGYHESGGQQPDHHQRQQSDHQLHGHGGLQCRS